MLCLILQNHIPQQQQQLPSNILQLRVNADSYIIRCTYISILVAYIQQINIKMFKICFQSFSFMQI